MTGAGKHCWQQPQHVIWNPSRRLRLSPKLLPRDFPPVQSMKLYYRSSLKRCSTKQVEQLKGRLTLSCIGVFIRGEKQFLTSFICGTLPHVNAGVLQMLLTFGGRLLQLRFPFKASIRCWVGRMALGVRVSVCACRDLLELHLYVCVITSCLSQAWNVKAVCYVEKW